MTLFRVIPELRSRGATVDLGAWYPWTAPIGTPMIVICGSVFIGMHGEYRLYKGIDDLHERTRKGILHN